MNHQLYQLPRTPPLHPILMMKGFANLLGILLLGAGWLLGQAGQTAGNRSGATIEGTLERTQDGRPALRVSPDRLVVLAGDSETIEVLTDERLAGRRMGVRGRYASGGRFLVAPFHTKAFWVLENGKKLYVSYWCSTCAIRTYTPGICMCCQKETALELRETP